MMLYDIVPNWGLITLMVQKFYSSRQKCAPGTVSFQRMAQFVGPVGFMIT